MGRVVVTAGGTREPIDDVRVLANTSTGEMGQLLAESFLEMGHDVVLLTSASTALPHRSWRTAAELESLLRDVLAEPVDAVLMAAAVADHSPVATAGKRSSDAPTANIELVRRTKILPTLRAKMGPTARLVGFKLLSGSTPEARAQAAAAQRAHGVDATACNDVTDWIDGRHPIHWHDASGSRTMFGDKRGVAHQIARATLPPLSTRVAVDVAWLANPHLARQYHLRTGQPVTWPGGALATPSGLSVAGRKAGPLAWEGQGLAVSASLGKAAIAALAGWADARCIPLIGLDLGAFGFERCGQPPNAQPDVRRGASALLVHTASGQVLLGRRQTPPLGIAPPGGACLPGEDPVETARRELREETGISVDGPPAATLVVPAPGEPPWRLTVALWFVQDAQKPKPTPTFVARWVRGAGRGALPGTLRALAWLSAGAP